MTNTDDPRHPSHMADAVLDAEGRCLLCVVELRDKHIEQLEAEVERFKLLLIEATNPGIDMEKVKESRHPFDTADAR